MSEKKYESLVPKRNLILGEYQTLLDFSLKEDDIRNVALTGAYGAGKSSVINSYENIHKEKSSFTFH